MSLRLLDRACGRDGEGSLWKADHRAVERDFVPAYYRTRLRDPRLITNQLLERGNVAPELLRLEDVRHPFGGER
jgi:hypothetical protein